MPKTLAISEEVKSVLRAATLTDGALHLGPEQLDRPLYVAVNKVIEALGGKWNRSKRCHIFTGDGLSELQGVLDAGKIVVDKFGYFPTPEPIARQLVDLAEIEPHHSILEPSAGQGHILRAIEAEMGRNGTAEIICIELQSKNCEVLRAKDWEVLEGDFLSIEPQQVDRVVMNPPFERQQDIDHVQAAFRWLKPGGRLVSVMCGNAMDRSNKKGEAFQRFFEVHQGRTIRNPEGSFKESGTGVNTIIVVIEKPLL